MHEERVELAYVTDTLISAFDHAPELFDARVLVMECTFLDERKSLEGARAGCHIHLDELIERADEFANEHDRDDALLAALPPRRGREDPRRARAAGAAQRIIPFVPDAVNWPG